jgi:hypothetical protein
MLGYGMLCDGNDPTGKVKGKCPRGGGAAVDCKDEIAHGWHCWRVVRGRASPDGATDHLENTVRETALSRETGQCAFRNGWCW